MIVIMVKVLFANYVGNICFVVGRDYLGNIFERSAESRWVAALWCISGEAKTCVLRGEYTLQPLLACISTMDVLPVAVYVAPGYMPAAWQDVLCYIGSMMLQRSAILVVFTSLMLKHAVNYALRYGIAVCFPAGRHPDPSLY